MFELEQAIAGWRKQMLATGIKSPVPLEELESHLRDHIDRLKTGLPDEEAFRTAAKELGDGKILKKEFSKGKILRLLRNNPVSLNIVAGCFMLSGINAVSQMPRMWNVDWPWTSFDWLCIGLAVAAFFGLQILVGFGLLQRVKFWQYCALVFSVLNIISSISGLVVPIPAPQLWHSPGYYFILLGMPVPMKFQLLIDPFMIGVWLWAISILTKPTVRNLFRPATAS